MMILLHSLLFVFALPAILACLYLGVLTLFSARLPEPVVTRRTLRFDVIVPAHNEALVIERTVASLCALDWPREGFRVLVVADNCSDQTADLARRAGATALERFDDTRRGKGYALEFGLARSAADGFADAVVVVDADTAVSPNMLAAFAGRIEAGAGAMQANYGVLNPLDTWRTRMVTLAYGAVHDVRFRARERFGLSCGLRGNGMCFTRAHLQAHPFRIYSMAEDLEYGVMLGLLGVRVHYVDEASADAEIPLSGSAASSQRQRWEGGRMAVARAYVGKLLAQAWRGKSAVCLDLALDLLTLPLGYIVLQLAILFVIGAVGALWLPGLAWWAWFAVALTAILLLHVLRGWQLSGLGPSALLDLARMPFFVAWKVYALVRNRHNRQWIRTKRNNEQD